MSPLFRRGLATLLALLALLSLFGCGDEAPDGDPLYQLNYVTIKDISRYGSLPTNTYHDITLTLGGECRYSEDTLDKWISNTLAQYPSYDYVTDRKVARGDVIRLYYTASVDGVVVKSHVSTADTPTPPLSLTVNSIDYLNLEGWNDALIGATCGVPVLFTLKAPDDYGNLDMRGKEVDFAVTVESIRQAVHLDALTAAYVTEILGFQTEETEEEAILSAFYTFLEGYLKDLARVNYENASKEAILKLLLQAYDLKAYPEEDVTYQFNSRYAYYESLRQYDNLQYYYAYGEENHFSSLEEYIRLCLSLPADKDPMEALREEAIAVVLKNLVIATVFHQERMGITEEEYLAFRDEVVANYLDEGFASKEEAIAALDEGMLYNELMWEHVLDYLLSESNCTILYTS